MTLVLIWAEQNADTLRRNALEIKYQGGDGNFNGSSGDWEIIKHNYADICDWLASESRGTLAKRDKRRLVDLWNSGKTWTEITRISLREFDKLDFDLLDKDEQNKQVDSITSQAKYYAKQNGITLRKGDRGRPTLQE